jgi:uncharacterized protein YdhG (YjbR/CyaY superfamily)
MALAGPRSPFQTVSTQSPGRAAVARMAEDRGAHAIDVYIASFPPEVQEILRNVRAALHRAVPGGEERFRYDMPAVMLGGRYGLHFAAWKKHLGLYPVARLAGPLEERIAPYRVAKDSLRFPYTRPVPYDLIEEIATALAAEHPAAD